MSVRSCLGGSALLLVVVVVLALPTAVAGPMSPSASAPHPPTVRALGPTPSLPRAASGSTIYYDSSVDGFNLSYQEFLPSGYNPSLPYPLAVELHGINTSADAPLPGGYHTTVVATTITAASAAGFILLVPDTRTGDGYYADSAHTGPQAQDILDAIADERALRDISAVYLYGFSMGAMGAMAIGLAHPTLFAGLGAIATESDMYELTSFSTTVHSLGVTNALLNTSGGYPNSSATAASIFNFLSALRQHPEASRGLKMYFTAGGSDTAIPDNPTIWPYPQANASLLQTSCLYVAAYDEPSNCTNPLAVYAATDPANYSFRFIYEANAIHDYLQVNATDLFSYFAGSVGPGLFVGKYPVPTPTLPPLPLVTLATVPFACGTIGINGVPYPNGFTLSLPPINFSVTASACTGRTLASITTTGGVTYNAATGSISVSGNGAVVARFSTSPTSRAIVQFLAASPCPFGTLNGTVVPVGSGLSLALGTYAIAAGTCPGKAFTDWVTTGSVSVGARISASTSLTVAGNGSVAPTYAVPPPAPVSVQISIYPSNCGPLSVNGTQLSSNQSVSLYDGSYPLLAPSCTGAAFAGWTSAGGVSTSGSGPTTELIVSGPGTITAVYTLLVASVDSVTFHVSPVACGAAIVVDGIAYAEGDVALLARGDHTLGTRSCTNYTFQSWSSTGGAIPSALSLVVAGNGSVSATFVSSGGGGPPATSTNTSGVNWLGSPWLWGAVGAAGGAAVTGVAMAWRARRPGAPPE